jgi:hypothetical protein
VSGHEIQGWYLRNKTSEAMRVRLSFVESSLVLHTLSGRLVASWSLDQLENREIAVLGERWSIGDHRVPEAYLELESDDEYRAVRNVSLQLRPVRARMWRQLGFAAIESGNRTGWAVLLLLIILAGAMLGLWQLA